MQRFESELISRRFLTYLPTFLPVLEEEEEDVEEEKLYDFDWTVPPEMQNNRRQRRCC